MRGRWNKGVCKKSPYFLGCFFFFAMLSQEKVTIPTAFLIKENFTPMCRGETGNSKYLSICAYPCRFGIESRWKIILAAKAFIDDFQLNPWSIHQQKWKIEEEEEGQQKASWGWKKNEIWSDKAKHDSVYEGEWWCLVRVVSWYDEGRGSSLTKCYFLR